MHQTERNYMLLANTERPIDIEKAIRRSDNRFIRNLPGFVVNIIRKIICEDELNFTTNRYSHLEGVHFLHGLLEGWNVNVIVRGEEKIPAEGRFVFSSNHPLGGLDAISLFTVIYKHFQEIVSPANQLLNHIPNLRSLVLALDVFGRTSRETAIMIDELFASGKQILIFPAGEVSRRQKGKISDIVWQKSFVTKAIQHKRDIIPVHVSGRNSSLFYNISSLRKFLGIKMYIETMLLPREMLCRKNSTITITFGNVIPWQSLTQEKTHSEWAQEIRQIVYSLEQT